MDLHPGRSPPNVLRAGASHPRSIEPNILGIECIYTVRELCFKITIITLQRSHWCFFVWLIKCGGEWGVLTDCLVKLWKAMKVLSCDFYYFFVFFSFLRRQLISPYCDTLRSNPLHLTCRQDQRAVAVCNLQKFPKQLPQEYQVSWILLYQINSCFCSCALQPGDHIWLYLVKILWSCEKCLLSLL